MFVPYEPDSPLDVYRNDEKCVCGASPILTNKGGENHGYCNSCAKKREKFAIYIIDSVFVDRDDKFRYAIINTLETIRVAAIKERIYYLVDKFFSENASNETFIEPYERSDFKLKVLREKCKIQEAFIEKIPFTETEEGLSILVGRKKELELIYNYYVKELRDQNQHDKRVMDSLCNNLSENVPSLNK